MIQNDITHNQNIRFNTEIKLHSFNGILLATILGGPIAAGILVLHNYFRLGNKLMGIVALFTGIFLMTGVLGAIYYIPQNIMDKIPGIVVPIIYTYIIYLLVDIYQGKILEMHSSNNRPFYSNWIAAGTGVVGMAVLLGGIYAFSFSEPENFDTRAYDSGISRIRSNEENALKLYSMLDSENTFKAVEFIEKVGLPAWNENLMILQQLDNINGITEPYQLQNDKFRTYIKLRIEAYKLIENSLLENTNAYDLQIAEIDKKIDLIINK